MCFACCIKLIYFARCFLLRIVSSTCFSCICKPSALLARSLHALQNGKACTHFARSEIDVGENVYEKFWLRCFQSPEKWDWKGQKVENAVAHCTKMYSFEWTIMIWSKWNEILMCTLTLNGIFVMNSMKFRMARAGIPRKILNIEWSNIIQRVSRMEASVTHNYFIYKREGTYCVHGTDCQYLHVPYKCRCKQFSLKIHQRLENFKLIFCKKKSSSMHKLFSPFDFLSLSFFCLSLTLFTNSTFFVETFRTFCSVYCFVYLILQNWKRIKYRWYWKLCRVYMPAFPPYWT